MPAQTKPHRRRPKTEHELPKIDHDRFANVVLFFLHRCPDAGLTKLLKLLYFADTEHYRRFLRPITNGTYVAFERGPVPQCYEDLLATLVHGGLLKKHNAKVFNFDKPMTKYVPTREPNIESFKPSELAVLEDVVEVWGTLDGAKLSAETHRMGPWSWVFAAAPGEKIPYALVRWLDNIGTDVDREAAIKALRRPALKPVLAELEASATKESEAASA